MNQIGPAELLVLLLLLFIVVFGIIARLLKTPYPIVMVIGGLLLSVIPGIPGFNLDPDLIFLVVLPPLLYSAAWTTSWRDFHFNLVSILMLAVGLVGFTVIGVAVAAPHVFPAFDWRLGLALGAIVAPTDAIAASAIARRVGLPGRIVDVLEGESLINDATGLLALEFATAIVVHNRVPTLATGILTFVWLVAGGIGIGLAVGWIVNLIESRIDDGPIEIILSILVPYAVYLTADALDTSGVLAVVACGLFLARRSAHFFSPTVRLEIGSFWQSFTFALNGLVFVLIGLQLPVIRASIRGYDISRLLLDGALFSVFLIVLRLIWVFPGSLIAYFLRTRLLHQADQKPPGKEVFVVGWTGMRGVVCLAAALALPSNMEGSAPFPQRNVIVFLTFCVIFVTLVLQGLTLPPLIRLLALARPKGPSCEEKEARRMVIEAAVSHLEEAKKTDSAEASEIYDHLLQHYRHRLTELDSGDEESEEVSEPGRHAKLALDTLRVERETAIELRNDGRVNDDVLRRIVRELDLIESRLVSEAE